MTATTPLPGSSSLTASERWRRTPLRWRIVMVVVAGAVLLEMSSSLVSGLGGSGSGAQGPSSAYDSSASGTEAFSQLLSERGYTVRRETVAVSAMSLSPGTTLLVLDPGSWTSSDTAAVRGDLAAGDHVVLGGRPPAGVLRSLLSAGDLPAWTTLAAGTAHPVGAGLALTGVTRVGSPGAGSFDTRSVAKAAQSGAVRPLLAGPSGVLALAGGRRGSLVILASSACLWNQALGHADNAAFALDLAGPPSTPVAFDEYDHGFGRAGTGLAGLPARWRWGLGLLLVALVVWVLSAARRFGPPALAERAMIPARAEYVDAMATVLTTRPVHELTDVLAPVYDEARRLAAARPGFTGTGDETDTAALLAALQRPPSDPADVVRVGRVLALLEQGETR